VKRIVVVGAGAAGLMAAGAAAAPGTETLLLESTPDGGRKILISGGGRCNILPARLEESRFITDSSRNTLQKIIRSWPLPEQIAFFEKLLSVPLVEEVESGKLFPASNKARDVRDGLLAWARKQSVIFRGSSPVTGASPEGSAWRIGLASGPPLSADAVILATGGLSVPKTGSDGRGLKVAELLGHTVHPTYAALTPLTAQPAPFAHLAGVSLPVTITARDAERSATATGGFLFTHHGYSGPSLLDVSHVAVRAPADDRAQIRIRWSALDRTAWEQRLRPEGVRTVLGTVRAEVPERLAIALIESAQVDPRRPLAQLKREERLKLIETLVAGSLSYTGHEGYKKAEVTGGGVSLAEIDPRTMESRKHPGLFLCGEMLDAFGPIGGYNFLWAWVTGRAAGAGAARRLREEG
jgi:predicted Rossmann fold flavoprotein